MDAADARERGVADAGAVKVSAVPARELSADLQASWAALQEGDARLDSPYFRPEFTAAVAAVRPSAEVGILQDSSGVIGFFPFERRALGLATPIGGPLSDFHGVVGDTDRIGDAATLLRGCRLTAWDFNHQLASQPWFAPFAEVHSRSPYIDLAAGVAEYLAASRASGSHNVPQLRRKERRLSEALGPIRFEADTTDRMVFEQTLAWKSSQYRLTGQPDAFAAPSWPRELLGRIQQHRDRAFAGVVSALYAGDRLIAGHIGMRSRHVWHYWFPAHDPAQGEFSPGSLLLLRMIEHAPEMGLTRIDLGKGEARYKSRFMNGALPLLEGRLERDSAVTTCRRAARRLYRWARVTPPARALRRFRYGPS